MAVKTMVFLCAGKDQDDETFEKWYLGEHADKVIASDCTRYVANILRQPTPEMIDAGWGWGAKDEAGTKAIDEIWVEDSSEVLSLYPEENVIMAYEVNQVDIKKCLPIDQPLRTKSPWIKRMGLLHRAEGMRKQDFSGYWINIHGPKALRIHIGSGQYEQNHFTKTIKEGPLEWDGSMSLYYWNIDSFRYGHFSYPGAQKDIAEDCANFQSTFLALPYGEEYVMKK